MNEMPLKKLPLEGDTLLQKLRHDLFNTILSLKCVIQNFEKGLTDNVELCEELHEILTQLEKAGRRLK